MEVRLSRGDGPPGGGRKDALRQPGLHFVHKISQGLDRHGQSNRFPVPACPYPTQYAHDLLRFAIDHKSAAGPRAKCFTVGKAVLKGQKTAWRIAPELTMKL